ncbi:hypothetical protein L917_03417, partial [Phytophthora nicotianae]
EPLHVGYRTRVVLRSRYEQQLESRGKGDCSRYERHRGRSTTVTYGAHNNPNYRDVVGDGRKLVQESDSEGGNPLTPAQKKHIKRQKRMEEMTEIDRNPPPPRESPRAAAQKVQNEWAS